MELPEQLLLLEPLHCTAEEILSSGARNPTAVQSYLECLEKGWLGQALIERYTYGESPSTPAGMVQTNEIKNGEFVEWLKPISDQIKDDLRELSRGRGYSNDLVDERDVYSKALLLHPEDPGRNLLIEVVCMMDEGLKNMPKICVVVRNTSGQEYAPEMQLNWGRGIHDAIVRLSEKMLEEEVLGIEMEKFGGSLYVGFQVDDEDAALALIEEMEEWS
ncbi:hypothetical protein QM012_000030 [Aureobasidium pullulans]|uniref:Uncharacterized protein n=1 Tax=Aureobasidium pullulans TaxID=5580 RepID=A0ABR0TUY7_AURPU